MDHEIQPSLALDERLSLMAQVEAILFATPKPMQPGEIMEILQDDGFSAKQVTEAIEHLKTYHTGRNGGLPSTICAVVAIRCKPWIRRVF